jgi:hypothetical protein
MPSVRQPQQELLTPEERDSALSTLMKGTLSGLGYVGSLLDKATGSRMLRGALAGRPREILSILPWSDTLGITDPSQIAWGKDVTRWDDPNRYIDNVVNFAAEVGLDPTLPFTGFLKGGLSGAGRALKLAGGLEDVDDALRLVAKGGHAGGAYKLTRRTGSTLREGLDALRETNVAGISRADDLADAMQKANPGKFEKLLDKPIGASINFGIPFGKPRGSFNIPFVDRLRDETIGRLKDSPMGRWAARTLNAASKEAKTSEMQMLFRNVSRQQERLMSDIMGTVGEYDRLGTLYRETFDAAQNGSVEAAQKLSSLVDFDSVQGKRQLYEWLEAPGAKVPEEYKALVGGMRSALDNIHSEGRKMAGVGRDLVSDEGVLYAPREAIFETPKGVTDPAEIHPVVKTTKEHARTEATRHIRGGTGKLMEIMSDPQVIAARGGKKFLKGKARKQAQAKLATVLVEKYGQGPNSALGYFLGSNSGKLKRFTSGSLQGLVDPAQDILKTPSLKRVAAGYDTAKLDVLVDTILDTPKSVLEQGGYDNPVKAFLNYVHKNTDKIALSQAQAWAMAEGVRAMRAGKIGKNAEVTTVGRLFEQANKKIGGKTHRIPLTRMQAPKYINAKPVHYLSIGRGKQYANPARNNGFRSILEKLATFDKKHKYHLEQLDKAGRHLDKLIARLPARKEILREMEAMGYKTPTRLFAGKAPIESWAKLHSEINAAESYIKRIFKKVSDAEVPKQLFDDATRWEKMISGTDALADLMKSWDSFTTVFKAGVLTWPARYNRDLYSALAQNAMLGQLSPGPALDAFTLVTKGKLFKGSAKKYLRPMAKYVKGMDEARIEKMTEAEAMETLRAWIASMDVISFDATRRGANVERRARPTRKGLDDLLGQKPGATKPGLRSAAKELGGIFKGPNKGWKSINPLNIEGVNGRTETLNAFARAGDVVGLTTDGIGRASALLTLAKRGIAPDEIIRRVKKAQVDYSLKNMTSVERTVLARAFPFWRFSKNVFPVVFEEIFDNPSGVMAQAFRTPGKLTEEGTQFVPEHLREGLSIPIPGGPFGSKDPSRQRYLLGLGLMHEDPAKYLRPGQTAFDTVSGTLSEVAGAMNPLIKAPLELATGTQLFSQRPLKDLEPGAGRMVSNVAKTFGYDMPVPNTPILLEQALSNLPTSRAMSTTRTMFDPAKGPADRALRFLTGVRITDIDLAKARQAAIRQELEDRLRGRRGISLVRPILYRNKRYTGQLDYMDDLLLRLHKEEQRKARSN